MKNKEYCALDTKLELHPDSRLKLIAFKRYERQKSIPKDEQKKSKICCFLISFSYKQRVFLCSVQKNTLYNKEKLPKSTSNNINQKHFAGIEESRPDP